MVKTTSLALLMLLNLALTAAHGSRETLPDNPTRAEGASAAVDSAKAIARIVPETSFDSL
ncbi:hypothetical protein ACFL5V_02130 [Fibrobacterota bacterium]